MNIPNPEFSLALRQEATRFREFVGFGRSAHLGRLFDFLVTATLEGRQPKEIEIAISVFGRSADFDAVQDASVRVYAHKLRRRLEEAYAAVPPGSPKLILPAGEYRLTLASRGAGEIDLLDARRVEPWWHTRLPRWLVLSAGLVSVATAATLLWYARPFASEHIASAPVQHVLANGKPTAIVIGDYYMVAETDGLEVKRLVREFGINSAIELEEFVASHPYNPRGYRDSGIRYLPTSSGYAVARIVAALASDEGSAGGRAPNVLLASELTPETIRNSNLIYIGYFSGLGPLSDIVGDVSRIETGPTFDELTDTMTGKHYISQTASSLAPNSPYFEYGALLSFSGPDQTRIIVLAGTRDVAVRQLTDSLLTMNRTLDPATRAVFAHDGEMLIEVTGLSGVNVQSHILAASPISTAKVWRQDGRP